MFVYTDIVDYHKNLMDGKYTCIDAVTHYIQKIKENNKLNAFLELFEEDSLKLALQLDNERKSGIKLRKLHGVILSIKDVISFKGHKLSASSNILDNFTSVYDSTVVSKLLEEGAIIIGRNNCDEFAMGSSNENSAYGPVLNYLDNTRVSGGSSGGSAVAVQAGLSMVSLGSDTGGSIRQPADYCGIIGLKPTYGRVSRHGLIAYASSFDQIGVFANNIDDAALVLEVISGMDAYDSTVSNKEVVSFKIDRENPKKYSFAYFKGTLSHNGIDKEISEQTSHFLKQLEIDGHKVEGVDFPYLDYVVPVYYILTTAESSSNLSRFDGIRYGYRSKMKVGDSLETLYKQSRSQGFGPEVKRRILLGTFVLSSGYSNAYFTKAQQVRKILYDFVIDLFSKYDAILSPTVPSTAPKVGERSSNPSEIFLADIFTVFANLVGIPAISVPLFKHSNKMPFGLQIMTKHFNEQQMLELADLFMGSH